MAPESHRRMSRWIYNFRRRTWRLRRHLHAAARYVTVRRMVNLARVELERMRGAVEVSGKPYILVIDPLNVCNLRCPLCLTGTGDLPLKPGKMKLDRFRALIDEIAPHTFKIIMYNWGEPFLHKDILPMVRHAHERRVGTVISSNLNILPEGGAEAVVRSGLDDLVVSCDGLSQEVYAKYRRGGKVETVIENLRKLVEAKKRLRSRTPMIEFQYLVFRHNEHEASRAEEFAYDLGVDFVRLTQPYLDEANPEFQPASDTDFVRPQYQDAPPENADKLDIFRPTADQEACAKEFPSPIKCFWPWRSMTINWNGQVDPCCRGNYFDAFGNVFDDGFAAVWNGPEYHYARKWITGKVGQDDPKRIVCRGCPGYN